MSEIDPQKLEILRTSLPKGLSAGDGGLTQPRGEIGQVASFPQFSSKVTESKTYSPDVSLPPVPQIAQDSPLPPPHPWQVLLRTKNKILQYKIDFNSTLYQGLGSFSNIAVTGLDFWDTASVGYLYLFGTIKNGVCTKASIEGPEDIPSDRIEFIDDEQNSFSVLIAYLYEDENSNIIVQQRAFHDFTLINSCINGKPAIYPIAT